MKYQTIVTLGAVGGHQDDCMTFAMGGVSEEIMSMVGGNGLM